MPKGLDEGLDIGRSQLRETDGPFLSAQCYSEGTWFSKEP